MAGSDDETTPPGWYRQKDDPTRLRWWDGAAWTEERLPTPAVAPAPRPTTAGAPEPVPPKIRIAEGAPTKRTRPPVGSAARPGQPTAKRTRPLSSPDRPASSVRDRPREPPPRSVEPREASHRIVGRHGRDRADQARIAFRVGVAVVVLVVALVGYVKLRDAGPADARTLTAKAAPVDKVSPTAIPLARVVLTVNDLPLGWATQSYNAAADDICLGRIPRSVLVPVEQQSATFTKGPSGPYITNVVARFANADVAKHFMDLTADTVDSCRSYVGSGTTIKLGPLSFPEFGDDTFAAKATGTSPYGALDGDIIYVRHGDRVASIQTISFGSAGITSQLVAFITRLLVRRL